MPRDPATLTMAAPAVTTLLGARVTVALVGVVPLPVVPVAVVPGSGALLVTTTTVDEETTSLDGCWVSTADEAGGAAPAAAQSSSVAGRTSSTEKGRVRLLGAGERMFVFSFFLPEWQTGVTY